MAIVRGSNPVWWLPDLDGLPFDDTYYLFVLDDQDPPQPSTHVWHDESGTVPWSAPIQFLANGTLPLDIWFDDGFVYRLEFRQGNTLDDEDSPLIYEVDNYSPNGSGGSPTSVNFQTSNQITNPQFLTVNFPDGYLTTDNVISVAPGWELRLSGGSGTRTTTLNRLEIAGDQNIITNPPYALRVLTAGWTSVELVQRFKQNGGLWASEEVSSSITARCTTLDVSVMLRARLFSSQAALESEVISRELTADYQELLGSNDLGESSNSDIPPAAYTEFVISWPGGVTVDITSIQLLSQSGVYDVRYEQDTIERQIDHLYNVAYPIVPIGTIIDYFGFNIPAHYLLCDYTAYSRVNYYNLFNTLTRTETVTLNSTDTFVVADGTIYSVGYGVEGTGIPANATIVSISMNDITISRAATVSTSQVLRFFAAGNQLTEIVTLVAAPSPNPNQFAVVDISLYAVGMSLQSFGTGIIPSGTYITTITPGISPAGTITMSQDATTAGSTVMYFFLPANGDGSTTFNVPDARRRVMVGSGGTVVSAPPLGIGNQLGNIGGEEAHLQLTAEVGAHVHPITIYNNINNAGTSGASAQAPSSGSTGINTPASIPFNVMQPSLITKKCIRFE